MSATFLSPNQVKALSARASEVARRHCEARGASLGEAYCPHISTQMSGIEQERNITLSTCCSITHWRGRITANKTAIGFPESTA